MLLKLFFIKKTLKNVLHIYEQDICVVFTLVLMVTMTFWNGIATLIHEDSVGLYDSIAMLLFVICWLAFSAILVAVICRKVGYVA